MDRPLRFCMITTFYPPYNFGGDGIYVHALANELGRRGHHIDVIHCRDAYRSLAGRDPAKSYADHANVRVHGLSSSYGFLSPLATQQTGFPLFKSARIRQILEHTPVIPHLIILQKPCALIMPTMPAPINMAAFINADLNFFKFSLWPAFGAVEFFVALPPKDGLFINTHLLRKLFLKQSQIQSPFPKMIA